MPFSARTLKSKYIGPGEHGHTVIQQFTLAAATPTQVRFDGLKLRNIDNAHLALGIQHTNGSAETVKGTMSVAPIIHASGEYITYQDATGGNFSVAVHGDFVRIKN